VHTLLDNEICRPSKPYGQCQRKHWWECCTAIVFRSGWQPELWVSRLWL
jgi:hypothetical protein